MILYVVRDLFSFTLIINEEKKDELKVIIYLNEDLSERFFKVAVCTTVTKLDKIGM